MYVRVQIATERSKTRTVLTDYCRVEIIFKCEAYRQKSFCLQH